MARAKKKQGTRYPFMYQSLQEHDFIESIPEKLSFMYEEVNFKWNYEDINKSEFAILKNKKIRKYTPDLVFPESDIILEIKGYLRPAAKKHLELFAKLYPDVDLRMVFKRDLPISRSAKQKTYVRWAELLGFKVCVASTWDDLPNEWKKELLCE